MEQDDKKPSGSATAASSSKQPANAAAPTAKPPAKKDPPQQEYRLTRDEQRSTGHVRWKVFGTYIAAMGGLLPLATVFVTFILI